MIDTPLSFNPSLPPSTQPAKLLYNCNCNYNHAIHGFSVHVTPTQLVKLRLVSGILSVIPDQIRQFHTTHTPTFVGLSESSRLWKNSGCGDGVIIGFLDTGIWPEHNSLSHSGLSDVPANWKGIRETRPDFPASSCNKKLIGARAFYNGYITHKGRPNEESKESASPRDTEGHGTHTATSAAGSLVHYASLFQYATREARGMASKARITTYKNCWSSGCYDSDILAAMDQDIYDGVHLISLSVGATGHAPRYDHDSIAIGAFSASQHGIVVSCSAGNAGPDP